MIDNKNKLVRQKFTSLQRMGNSCKGVLSTPRGGVSTVDAAQSQPRGSNHTVCSLYPLEPDACPVSLIRVEPRPSVSGSLPMFDTDSTSDAAIGCQDALTDNQDGKHVSSSTSSNLTNSDFGLDLSFSHSVSNMEKEEVVVTKQDVHASNVMVENVNSVVGHSDWGNLSPALLVNEQTQCSDHPPVVLDQGQPFHQETESRKIREKVTNESSMSRRKDELARHSSNVRSQSFDSIETLSLENIEMPNCKLSAHSGLRAEFFHSVLDTLKENSQTPLPDNEDKQLREKFFSHITKANDEQSRIGSDNFDDAGWASSPLSEHDPGVNEAQLAIVNVLHTLYYGKRRKYRGWSSFGGKAINSSNSFYGGPNRHEKQSAVIKATIGEKHHEQDPLSTDIEKYASPRLLNMELKLNEECAEVNTKAQLIIPATTEQNLPCENCQTNKDSSKQWPTETSSPAHRFPFNLYRERNQIVSKSLFPLADFRFDDGAYSNTFDQTSKENRSERPHYPRKPNPVKQQNNEKSLASALSIAGHLVKGFSVSESAQSKTRPSRIGLNFRAGASLNDVFVNVTSSLKLSGDAQNVPKGVASETQALQTGKQYAQASPSKSLEEVGSCQAECKPLTEYKRQQKRLESLEEMLKPLPSRKQTLNSAKKIDGQGLTNCQFKESREDLSNKLKTDIYRPFMAGGLHLDVSPLKLHVSHKANVSRFLKPLSPLTTVAAANTVLCSSSPISTNWRGFSKIDSNSLSKTAARHQRSSPVSGLGLRINGERENVVKNDAFVCPRYCSTEQGAKLLTSQESLNRRSPKNQLSNNIFQKKNLQPSAPVSEHKTVQRSVSAACARVEGYVENSGLLAGRTRVDGLSSRLVYSRHMNK